MEKESMKGLGKVNKGFRHERVNHINPLSTSDINREMVFYKHWVKENEYRSGTNYGQGILQDLFFEGTHPMNTPIKMLKIKPIHRFIVATIIQWLGTNVGFSFILECLRDCGYSVKQIDRNN
jgi:hypothetical protein